MSYDVKNVFFLDIDLEIAKATAGMTSAQLDLSAYIDPIAKGRTKGTGLAIYKCHYDVSDSATGGEAMIVSEAGVFRAGIVAGAGLGNSATGAKTAAGNQQPSAGNALAVFGFDYYGPASCAANASPPAVPMQSTYLKPSEKVPYVVVRDNVCLVVEQRVNMTEIAYVNMRLECAQVTLDQATLNQLLRTQTV
jgi:hypothetical protein